MAQSPTISIPRKTTEEVDWTGPIRNIISHSYGESPDSYAAECAALQRCRQDAVRGAGSDTTGRDLLYKYFGQLELLELRFAELRVAFPWRDAFTSKLTTQNSIAFEKASIIFQIAATHSSIASSQNRSDPEGLKRAYYYFRTTAGMLTYINDNFLHAPSTDLSREVVRFLVNIMLAQAHEVLFEKSVDEKKGPALISKIVAQAASICTALSEDVKEFMGKGIFDRNWVTLIQIKAKYFASLSQYYRSLADIAAGKHGDALARLGVAENLAKEANRSASSFSPYFITTLSPTLPADAGASILQITKAHLALCSEKKAEAQRDNDLIYNAIVPSEATLPVIEKLAVATPIPIQEVYGTPEVQKTIGQDLFIKLVPLSVHESASVYSEEKAKLVRTEVEKADEADSELKAALESLGIKTGLGRYRAMVENSNTANVIPTEVRGWCDEVARTEEKEPITSALAELERLKNTTRSELEAAGRDLDNDNRECEAMRVKYDHLWTQEPSGILAKSFRQDIKAHRSALEAASLSDNQVVILWDSAKADIALLLSTQLEEIFRSQLSSGGPSLLDVDTGLEEQDRDDRVKIGHMISAIEEKLGKLNKISRERKEVLKDLKEKIQADDVSHLLLLNRRNAGVEPTLFASQLEKFRPLQTRLAATVHYQEITLQEIAAEWTALKDYAGKAAGARQYEDIERKKIDTVRRFSHARDRWSEVREGLLKGFQFYQQLSELLAELRHHITDFVRKRATERQVLVAEAETKTRLQSNAPAPERPPPPPIIASLTGSMSNMKLSTSPPPQTHTPTQWNIPPPPPPLASQALYTPPVPRPPPPPSLPPVQQSAPFGNPYDFSSASSFSAFSLSQPPVPPPPPVSHFSGPPVAASPVSATYAPPVQKSSQYSQSPPSHAAFPPPPPPIRQMSFPSQQQPYQTPAPYVQQYPLPPSQSPAQQYQTPTYQQASVPALSGHYQSQYQSSPPPPPEQYPYGTPQQPYYSQYSGPQPSQPNQYAYGR